MVVEGPASLLGRYRRFWNGNGADSPSEMG
jgi:hypothetical protein